MAVYTLRAFDRELAITGFRCIMLTGSHFEGSLIDDKDKDIKGVVTGATYKYGDIQIIIDDNTYSFDTMGKCKNANFKDYRLMLADTSTGTSLEEVLSNIYGSLLLINNTLDTYCEGVKTKIADMQKEIEELRAKIPDIRGLASEDYVDDAISGVNDRIDKYHPNNK